MSLDTDELVVLRAAGEIPSEILDLYKRCAELQADQDRLDWIERNLNPDGGRWCVGVCSLIVRVVRRHDRATKTLREAVDAKMKKSSTQPASTEPT